MQIFSKKISENGWSETISKRNWFENKKDNFKNYGRDVEILLSNTKICHGKRIFG